MKNFIVKRNQKINSASFTNLNIEIDLAETIIIVVLQAYCFKWHNKASFTRIN